MINEYINKSHVCDKHNIREMKKAKYPKTKINILEKRWDNEHLNFVRKWNKTQISQIHLRW